MPGFTAEESVEVSISKIAECDDLGGVTAEEEEVQGLDLSQDGEEGYDWEALELRLAEKFSEHSGVRA